MTHIRSIFSEEDEKKALQDGLIAVRKHPEKELFIYCYTKRAPYTEGAWTNPAVLHSRGLIVNDQGHVVARPWKKFFNYGTADAPYFNPSAHALRVLDKADGSLGILYFDGDKWAISTKGSFTSDMAIHANKVWQEKYSDLSPNPDYTFLFEIVYKEGRIVVDYGDTDDLYFLGAVEKASGLPLSLAAAHGVWSPGTEELWTGPQVERFNDFASVQEVLDAPERENAEGYVCIDTYTGAMVKVKHKTYLEKHRLYTNLTPRKVWEMLNEGMTYEEVLGEFPDEFEAQVREYLDKIKTDYDELCFQIGVTYESIKHIEEQKDFAAEALKFHYQGELFMLRQGRSIHESVMKKIYPDAVDKK